MKISLNELKKYVDIKVSTEELIKLIEDRLKVWIDSVSFRTYKWEELF